MLDQFELVGRAIADPNRVRILKLLEEGELCVCQVAAVLSLAPATVSKHLTMLRLAGLLNQRKDGRWVYHGLAESARNPYVSPMLALLRNSLVDDPTANGDKAKLREVRAVPITELCSTEAIALE
jgi:DNA-binding transcriptional ArsR family regulator